MSIVDRINRLIMCRMERTLPVVEGDSLRIGREVLPLAELCGVVAHEADVHAGALIALTLAFRNGSGTMVTQDDPCWNDLVSALDRLSLTSAPSRDWISAVLAGASAGSPIVLRRDGRASA
ncbi:hypothetical protein [Lichenibacterium dinghuense]|uniref:hypothetical protein n=1 Tax=Lichenibacterium dinghuense TaxID=2895977 RepID=UPI001F261330|nr:hypothetical protein [Lichenibacterium sp. 6Y81]